MRSPLNAERPLSDNELLRKLIGRLTAVVVILGVMLALSVGVLVTSIIIGARLNEDEAFMMTRLRFYTKLAPRLMAQTARSDHDTLALDYVDPSAVTANAERRMRLERINALMDAVEAGQSLSLSDDEKLLIEMLISDFLRMHLVLERSHSIVNTADTLLLNASSLLTDRSLELVLGDVAGLLETGTLLASELLNYTRGLADGSEALKLRFKKK